MIARIVPAFIVAAILTVGVSRPLRASASTAATGSADTARTGWYSDQTALTPTLVSGGTFGQLFSTPIVGQVYGQPLVVNGVVLVVTEANWVYGIDAVTGAIRWSRSVGTPFNPQDVACSDLLPNVGITGTPAVDEATNTAYFVAKSYVSGTSGAAQIQMHAVDIATGAERSGFPATIQGSAQNNPGQAFTPKTQHQRPGLLLMNGVVYAAFGAHCDFVPYAGWIAGVSTAGTQVALFSTRAGSPTGSGAGIWQSGGGLVSDRSGSIIFATGNGIGGGSATTPTPGSQPPADLGESVVRVNVQPNGSLAAKDFFTPFDAATMDANDADLGSGGPVALPPQWFGTTSVPNVIVEMGKQGYLYVLDANNLGGAQEGPGGGDNVVNRLGPFGGVYSHPAVWPGDGGYIYVPMASGSLVAFKYGVDGTSKPTFSQAGKSSDSFGFGSGAPVVTSNSTTSGSALVWVIWSADSTGANAQLRAYDPVPNSTGGLVQRFAAPIGTSSKFVSPGVGGNRIYVGTRDGHLLGFGAPVNPPVTVPAVAFPTTVVGQTATATATISAGTNVTVSSLSITGAAFSAGTASRSLPATLTAGQTMTVPITFSPTTAGTIAGTLNVTTSSGIAQAPLSGSALAATGTLTHSPVLLSFGGTPVGGILTGTVVFSNVGGTPVTLQSFTPPAAPFSVTALPAPGTILAPAASVSITVSFAPTAVGQFTGAVTVVSNAGSQSVPLSGSAALPGVLTISPLSLDFGTVSVGATKSSSFTVSNTGASTLTLTKSKPPSLGQFHAISPLAEQSTLAAGQSVIIQMSFAPLTTGPLTDTWVLNSDQPGSVVQTVTFTGVGSPATGVVIPDPSSGGWKLNGSATLLGTTPGSLLQLTSTAAFQAGSAFWPTAVSSSTISASFDAQIGGGTGGADGLTILFADPTLGASPASLGAAGGGLGASGIPGVAVSLVTFPSDLVGISKNGVSGAFPNYLATTTTIPPLRTAVRHVGVTVQSGLMTVSIDGTTVLSTATSLPPNVLVGFTGGTGASTDQHAVANVVVSTAATPGVLSVTPGSVDFGTVVTGTTASHTLTITNTGGGPLTLGSATAPTAPFALVGVPAAGTVVPAGQSVPATVTFAPTAAGAASGSLVIDSSGGPVTVSVAGTGAVPAPGILTVTPASVTFGSVFTGVSASLTLSVANTGLSPLAINSLTVPSAPFTVTGLPLPGSALAPGQVVQATATFAPTAAGPASATLTIASSVGSGSVSLAGVGVLSPPAVLSVTPGSLAFGSVGVGSSPTRTVTISNTGGSSLTFQGPTLPSAPYAVSGLPAAGSILPAGQSVTATVTFAPTAVGPAAGSITVASSVGSATVSLSGSGILGVVIPDPTVGGWTLNGSATLLGTTPGSLLRLTPASPFTAGSAFWPSVVSSSTIDAIFDVTIGGGGASGADGETFLLANPTQGAVPTSLGGPGGGLGASGIAGTAVTFDTYPSDLVGIASAATSGSAFPNYLVSTSTIPALRTAVRHVHVTVVSGTMTVSIDGAQVLSHAVTLPPNVLVGFTGGTGSVFDQHSVSNVSVVSTVPTASLLVTPTAVDFGTVTTGSSLSRTISITNTGVGPLTVSSGALPSAPYTVTGWPAVGSTVAAGATVTATVTFAPTTTGAATSSLGLGTSAGSATISLTGIGAVGPAVLSVTPAAVAFGSVAVASSATRTLSIANTGGGPLTITSISGLPAPFSASGLPAIGASVAGGQAIVATITFAPTTAVSSTVALTVVTSAGTTSATITGTGTSGFVIPDPTAGGWKTNGSASLLGTAPGSLLQLTPASGFAAGSAFWPTAVSPTSLVATFDMTIGGGSGADGMTFILADPSKGATPSSLGSAGGGLGFAGVAGVAVGFVTFTQSNPSANLVGISTGAASGSSPTWVVSSSAIPPLRTAVRHVRVAVTNGTMTVSVDGTQVLSQAVTLPPSVLVGFSGGTGGLNDQHAVANVSISG